MSLTGRVDEGMVTQDDTMIDDGNDNLGYLMERTQKSMPNRSGSPEWRMPF
jgi:hypothetical protein